MSSTVMSASAMWSRQMRAGRREPVALGPGRRLPQLRPDERLRAVQVRLVGLDDDRGDRRLASVAVALEELGIAGDRGSPVHTERLAHAGDGEQEPDPPGGDDVADGVEAPVARLVGQHEGARADHVAEAGDTAPRRRVARPVLADRRDGHERGERDERPAVLVELRDRLDLDRLVRRAVQLGDLVLARHKVLLSGAHARSLRPGLALGPYAMRDTPCASLAPIRSSRPEPGAARRRS